VYDPISDRFIEVDNRELERFSRRQLLRRSTVAGLALAAALDTTDAVEAAARPVPRRAGAFVDRLNALQNAFRSPIGNWQAGDIPHAYALPDKTTLWLLNDSFLSASPNGPIDPTAVFVRNAALLESQQSKLTLLESRHSYLDNGEQLLDRWWWFHGGHVEGRLIQVVTTEMVRTDALGWAINFEPASTWITTIDWPTTRIVRMQPAPNNGVTPVYGFSMASDHAWTYLYGNNHLYGRATTENRVARVPRGRLLDTPTYWDGEAWAADPNAAISILTHGTFACRLYVFRHGNRWLATAKDEEFYGDEILLFEALQPTGPWRIIRSFAPPTKTGDTQTCTYDAMARTLTPGSLLLWWSNNAYDEQLVRAEPAIYRPSFTELTLPVPVGRP
jgi:hypothetical protein